MSAPRNSREDLLAASTRALKGGRRDEAVALARQAAEAFPDHPGVLQALVDALTQSGAYAFNPALERKLLADGSLAGAVRVLEHATAVNGSNHLWFLELGNCLTALGEYDRAAKALRRATDLYLPLARPDLTFAGLDAAPVIRPSFFVIGSVKCGTTSLFDHMTAHPAILPAVTKESHYFHHPERGLAWYLAQFPRRPDGREAYVTGDFSASTINAHDAPAMLHAMAPGARLIALVRDPVDRAISHFHMNQRVGVEQRPLEAAMAEELEHLANGEASDDYAATQQGYLSIGLYAREIERWLGVFPREQLLILVMEEMRADPASVVDQAFAHIGVRPHQLHAFKRLNEGLYGEGADAGVRKQLHDFFKSHNEEFYALLGRRLAWDDQASATGRAPPPAANRARGLAGEGRLAEAAAAWKACLAEAPDHPDAAWWRQSMSEALLKAGDLDGAEAGFEDMVSGDGQSAPGREGLARVALARGNPLDAAHRLEACIDAFPRHPNRRSWMAEAGHALTGCGELGRAEAMFRRIVSDYPGEGAGPAGLARIAQARQDYPLAVSLWRDALTRFPMHPDRPWWLQGLALALIRSGALDRAEEVSLTLAADYPDVPAGLSGLAEIALRRSDHARAAEVLGECIRRFPSDPNRRWWLPSYLNALISLGDTASAEAAGDQLILEFPEDAAALAALARLETLRGDLPLASSLWEQCLSRFPGHPDRSWWLLLAGQLYLDRQMPGAAEAVFRTAAAEFPGEARGWAGMANAVRLQGRGPEAAELWNRCIAMFPDHPERSWWLPAHGHVLLDLGRHAEADAVFSRLDREFPGDQAGIAGLARSAYLAADWPRASRLLGEALKRFPGDPRGNGWAGMQRHAINQLEALREPAGKP